MSNNYYLLRDDDKEQWIAFEPPVEIIKGLVLCPISAIKWFFRILSTEVIHALSASIATKKNSSSNLPRA